MTNKDKINKMSAEELAHFLHFFGCCECSFNLECCGYHNCIEGHKEWLEQEVEEKDD